MHKHWCEYAGHGWECCGAAVREFDVEATTCMCLNHRVPMEEGDHSDCSIEVFACPEHRDAQLRAMGFEPGQVRTDHDERSMFTDADGNRIVGFCLWCSRDFYTCEEAETHMADGMAACGVFQALKGETKVPPLLQTVFEESGTSGPADGSGKPTLQ